MFLQKLKTFFLALTILATLFLIYNWYENFQFKNNPLSSSIKEQINTKHRYLESLAYKRFNIKRKIPIIISEKMPSKLFGAASLSKSGKIIIYLNKNHFQESLDYMINDVLPHEYAHALMFIYGKTTNKNGGHTKEWQNICRALNGLRCDRFVNHDDIIIGKTNFF